MSAKVIHLAGERARRQQLDLLQALARGVARIPVEPPPARVLTMAPEAIDRWLRDERLEPAHFWRGMPRQPIAIGDVSDAIAALLRGRDAYLPPAPAGDDEPAP